MFEGPDLFPHQDPNLGDRKTKQNMEQRIVLFAKGSVVGKHKENGKSYPAEARQRLPKEETLAFNF